MYADTEEWYYNHSEMIGFNTIFWVELSFGSAVD